MVTVERNRSNEGSHILLVLLGAQKHFFVENDTYTGIMAQLDVDIPGAQYFNPPTIANNPTNLASIMRIPGQFNYTLSVDENSQITCSVIGPGNICAQMGY